jgi:hypothetical protein
LDPKPGPGWYDFIFERFEYKGKIFWQCFTHSIGELDMVGMVKHGVQPPLRLEVLIGRGFSILKKETSSQANL